MDRAFQHAAKVKEEGNAQAREQKLCTVGRRGKEATEEEMVGYRGSGVGAGTESSWSYGPDPK